MSMVRALGPGDYKSEARIASCDCILAVSYRLLSLTPTCKDRNLVTARTGDLELTENSVRIEASGGKPSIACSAT